MDSGERIQTKTDTSPHQEKTKQSKHMKPTTQTKSYRQQVKNSDILEV